ncbi:MAG: HAD family phosphatase [Chloroflexi bacterium]|nr:HAD family phosphatase [Chloroflexota bacterium]
MIHLAAFDLDNTLVGPGLTLSPRVKAAVARAQAKGVIVTIATGRGPSPTDQFAAALDLTAPLICFQGGIVYDYRQKQILHETRLDRAVVPIIVRLAGERGWNLSFECPDMIYLPRDSDHPEELFELMRVANWKRVDNFHTDLPETPHKFILSVHDRAERDALANELRASFDGELAKITVVPSHPILVEGLPRGMSKAVGLAWLADYFSLKPEEVMAVGDNDNDAEMLRWAGLGVAMADGSPAALASADEFVPPAAEDGAAIALEKFVLRDEN